jgi:hypothetical protein
MTQPKKGRGLKTIDYKELTASLPASLQVEGGPYQSSNPRRKTE